MVGIINDSDFINIAISLMEFIEEQGEKISHKCRVNNAPHCSHFRPLNKIYLISSCDNDPDVTFKKLKRIGARQRPNAVFLPEPQNSENETRIAWG